MKTIYSNKKATFFLFLTLWFFLNENVFAQRVPPEDEINYFNLTSERENKVQNFHLKNIMGNVYLQWLSFNDKEDGIFIISRSKNKIDFKLVGIKEDAVAENKKTRMHNFIDKSPVSGISYYRILKIYKDGTYYFSDLESTEITIEIDDWQEQKIAL